MVFDLHASKVVLHGTLENISHVFVILRRSLTGFRSRHGALRDTHAEYMVYDGSPCAIGWQEADTRQPRSVLAEVSVAQVDLATFFEVSEKSSTRSN